MKLAHSLRGFGAKRTIAPAILEEVGPHRAWWEPFCGSMAMLLAKPPSRTEVVNDLHGDLINLARVVRDPVLGPKLYRILRRTLFAQELFRDSLAVVRGEPSPAVPAEDGPEAVAALDVARAAHYFTVSWMGMNGVAGTSSLNSNYAVRYSSLGGDPAVRWRSAIRSIPGWRRRMERVTVLSMDAFTLLSKAEDDDGVVIYCDPPYLKKGAKYLHDFAAEDHAKLAALLFRFTKTRVIVSYYDHPDLAVMYPGWRVVHVKATKSVVNSGKRDTGGATVAPEVLLINQPPVGGAGHGANRLFS